MFSLFSLLLGENHEKSSIAPQKFILKNTIVQNINHYILKNCENPLKSDDSEKINSLDSTLLMI